MHWPSVLLLLSSLIGAAASNPAGAAEPGVDGACRAAAMPAPPSFDAARLAEGRFTYRVEADGTRLGRATIEVRRRRDGSYRITFDSKDLQQRWRSDLRRDFRPLTAELAIGQGPKAYAMNVTYDVAMARGVESVGALRRPVRTALAGPVVDQRVDWAAMMAASWPDHARAGFQVYDPGSGSSRVVGSMAPAGAVDGPHGPQPGLRLEYTICKSDHAESYVVWATEAFPRVMLREDMPGGVRSTLVRIQP